MLKRKKNKFVYTELKFKDPAGFTLVSNLLALTLIFIAVPFIGGLIETIKQPTAYEELSVNQFFYHFQQEFSNTKSIHVQGEKIELVTINDRVILYEKYNDVIRRRVNKEGHEIYLRDISDVSFKYLENGVEIQVLTTEGNRYEKYFMFYTK